MELGIAGWPLEGSLSPKIHSEFLRISGIEGAYRPYPIEADEFFPLLTRLHLVGVRGLNITSPYKTMVLDSCFDLGPEAVASGAVNTLLSMDGGWKGINTDVAGFLDSFNAFGCPDPVFVAGSGGAARAVCRALSLESRNFTVFCRNPVMWGGEGKALPLSELSVHVGVSSGTVVNATVLGWQDDDEFPLEVATPGRLCFYDLNYNPGWEWRNRLGDCGVTVHTGEDMLVRQAAESFRLWTGVALDEGVLSGVTAALHTGETD
jgi:shikimate dehydrogenase